MSTQQPLPKTSVQQQAVRLLRGLLADYRMETVAAALGYPDHTVRRMLNGTRAVSLADAVNLARLAGASMDEQFGLQRQPMAGPGELQDGLSKVFLAISEMLAGAPIRGAALEPAESELIELRRHEPQGSEMVKLLSKEAQRTLERLVHGDESGSRRARRTRSA